VKSVNFVLGRQCTSFDNLLYCYLYN